MNANAFYKQKAESRVHGHLQWCGHCHCFHHGGRCPCAEKIAALEAAVYEFKVKILELRGLLAERATEQESR